MLRLLRQILLATLAVLAFLLIVVPFTLIYLLVQGVRLLAGAGRRRTETRPSPHTGTQPVVVIAPRS